MTSVNVMNAEQRAIAKGRVDGYKLGHDDGYGKGYSEALEYFYKEKRTLRLYRYAIVFVIGYLLSAIVGAHTTFAQTSIPTTVTVTISAEVVCNTTNCPEIPVEETAVIENITQEQTLLQRIWSAIVRALT